MVKLIEKFHNGYELPSTRIIVDCTWKYNKKIFVKNT